MIEYRKILKKFVKQSIGRLNILSIFGVVAIGVLIYRDLQGLDVLPFLIPFCLALLIVHVHSQFDFGLIDDLIKTETSKSKVNSLIIDDYRIVKRFCKTSYHLGTAFSTCVIFFATYKIFAYI